MDRRPLLVITAASAVELLFARDTLKAQAIWPRKPVHFVVPYTAGGFSDKIMRRLAPLLNERLGQPIVVENKPGANSITGVDYVAKSVPDGHTFGLVIAAFAANDRLYPKLPYRSARDLAPVTLIATAPLIAASSNTAPFGSVRELIAYGHANPEKLTYGSTGRGSAAHLTTELFQELAGIKMIHVPYRGAPQAITDLSGGQIHLLMDIGSNIIQAVKAGRARFIGVATDGRIPELPEVPTFQEQGVAGLVGGSWVGVVAPRGTPTEIVARLSTEITAVVRSEEWVNWLRALPAVPGGGSPQEFEQYLASEIEKWGGIIQRANITPD